MHLRVVTIRNESGIGKEIGEVLKGMSGAVPNIIKSMEGLQGLTVTADLEHGVIENVFFWKSAADMVANSPLNENQVDAEGRPVPHLYEMIDGWQVVEVLQEAMVDLAKAPALGNVTHVQRIALLTGRIDEYVAYLKSEVIPRCKAVGGFLGVRLAADIGRICGLAIVYLYWEDEAAMTTGVMQEKMHEAEAAAHGARVLEETFRQVYA